MRPVARAAWARQGAPVRRAASARDDVHAALAGSGALRLLLRLPVRDERHEALAEARAEGASPVEEAGGDSGLRENVNHERPHEDVKERALWELCQTSLLARRRERIVSFRVPC